MIVTRARAVAILASSFLLGGAIPAFAYQFDYGTPEIVSPLSVELGEVLVRFGHRFNTAEFPDDNGIALNLGLGVTPKLTTDFSFTTNEHRLYDGELSVRYQWLDQYDDAPLSLGTRVGYGTVPVGTGIAEVTISRNNLLPNLGVGAIGRYFTNVGNLANLSNAGGMAATGLGLSYSLWKGVNLVGDVMAPLDQRVIAVNGFSWTAGVQIWIKDTPHVLTLFAGRMGDGTSYGRTFSSGMDTFRAGFEYDFHVEIPRFPGKPNYNK